MKLVGTCISKDLEGSKITKGKKYNIVKVFKGEKYDVCGIVMIVDDNKQLRKVSGTCFEFEVK